jgi:F-type H+-transporting ATPase subunit delta
MPSASDKEMTLARVYARSLMTLAARAGKAKEILEELNELARGLQAVPALAEFFGSPLVGNEARRSTVEKLFRGKLSDLVVDTLQVMSSKGRLALLPAMVEGFRQELRDASGEVDVYVTTAVPLSDALRGRLKSAADAFTGRASHLIEHVDPKLLGGMVVRVADQKVDSSVARSLERLAAQLAERASREILSSREGATDDHAAVDGLKRAFSGLLDRASSEITGKAAPAG